MAKHKEIRNSTAEFLCLKSLFNPVNFLFFFLPKTYISILEFSFF